MTFTNDYSELLRLKKTGQTKAALQEIRKALNLKPSDPYLNYLLGMTLREIDRVGEARAYLKAAAELAPAKSEPWVELARTYKWKGEEHLASECFEKAIYLNPRNQFAWTALGMMEAYGRADIKAAREALEMALEIDPHSIGAIDALAVT